MISRWPQAGFTLVELITVVVILGIMSSFLALVVIQPFRAADDITQRARLTDELDLAMAQIQREVRTAVPNSVRVEGPDSEAVEFVPTETGGRYRRLPAPGGGSDRLNRAQTSDRFDVLGKVSDFADIDTASSGGIGCADDPDPDEDCINIFNTGQTGFDIYDSDNSGNPDNIAKITGISGEGTADLSDDELTYDNGGANTPAFNAHSPNQRFLVFDDVVSFVCDGNDLLRFSTYGLQSNQPTDPADFPDAGSLVVDDLTNCAFSYDAGAATRQGLLKVELELTRNNETVELFHQIHVINVP